MRSTSSSRDAAAAASGRSGHLAAAARYAHCVESWLTAGGAHHTVLTQAFDHEPLVDFAEMAGIELLLIDENARAASIQERDPLESGLLPSRPRPLTVTRSRASSCVPRRGLALEPDHRRAGLVTLSFGNASGIDRAAHVLIKPSGVPIGPAAGASRCGLISMTVEPLSGAFAHRPTRRPIWRCIGLIPEVPGVVHTHSRAATSWAQAGRSIPPFGTTHADHFHGPSRSRAGSVTTKSQVNTRPQRAP